MNWEFGVAFMALALALASVPGGALINDPVPGPPPGLEVKYDEETHEVRLTWKSPSKTGDYLYNVYRNGTLLASVNETWFKDSLVPDVVTGDVYGIYFVTAVDQRTNMEGPPTNPVVVSDLTPCELVIIVVNPNSTIPVSVGVNEACKERWERTVDSTFLRVIDLIERMLKPPGTGPIVGDNLR